MTPWTVAHQAPLSMGFSRQEDWSGLPFPLYDWENAIALDAIKGNWASSRGEAEVSWIFSSCGSTWGIFSSYDGDAHSKREFV